MSATDKDLPFAGITYSIVGGGGTFGYTNIFWIDPEKGDMKIIATLDYETTQRYILTVQASDSEKTATVSVSKSAPTSVHLTVFIYYFLPCRWQE